ncbi:hypothetical protein RJ639_034675 [Escallonia herrerae]|uniref:Uncharacterized protein n=1 Tax=Escallonia herrerae TaxID=1293975 RepID=A0AA89BBI8_9ASTE|nr:hypothetical protein RJ639_034675 [Escallonia herrerae]
MVEGMGNLQRKVKMNVYRLNSWCYMGLYNMDFGWGKPVWVGNMGDPEDKRSKQGVLFIERGDGTEVSCNPTSVITTPTSRNTRVAYEEVRVRRRSTLRAKVATGTVLDPTRIEALAASLQPLRPKMVMLSVAWQPMQ